MIENLYSITLRRWCGAFVANRDGSTVGPGSGLTEGAAVAKPSTEPGSHGTDGTAESRRDDGQRTRRNGTGVWNDARPSSRNEDAE